MKFLAAEQLSINLKNRLRRINPKEVVHFSSPRSIVFRFMELYILSKLIMDMGKNEQQIESAFKAS
jgi:hypothetical protein